MRFWGKLFNIPYEKFGDEEARRTTEGSAQNRPITCLSTTKSQPPLILLSIDPEKLFNFHFFTFKYKI